MTQSEIRDSLGIPKSSGWLDAKSAIALDLRARAGVLSAKQAILKSGTQNEDRVKLLFETLANNLYGIEDYVGRRIFSVLNSQDYFGPTGSGDVLPIALDGKSDKMIFLGRKIPYDRVIESGLSFDSDTEDAFRIVILQARGVSRFFDSLPGYDKRISLPALAGLIGILILARSSR